MVTSQSATVLTQQQQQTLSFFLFALWDCFRSGGEGSRKTEREGAVSVGWSQITDRRG